MLFNELSYSSKSRWWLNPCRYLSLKPSKEIEEVKLVVVDEVERLPDDTVDRLLRSRQQGHQPDLHAALGSHGPLQVDDLTFSWHDGQDFVVVLMTEKVDNNLA